MDFACSYQQRELLDAVGRFASQQLNYNVIDNDRDGVFNHDAWKKCGSFGIQGLPVPTEHGGLGMDPLTTVAALERLGYACKDNGLLFSINAHLWTAVIPLVYNGSEAQKKKYLPGLCNGTLIGGNAMSEPNSGSDAFALATTAIKKDSRYVLNGSKILDMKLRVESSRHMLYHYGWLSGHRKAVYLEAAMTKLHISDCWVKCCEDAIQIHGGYGYMTEYEVERELRDAIGSKLYSGTSEIQRNIIASMLGL